MQFNSDDEDDEDEDKHQHSKFYNQEKAVTLYKAAADQDHPAATRQYGLALLKGKGTTKDSDKAMDMLYRAAELGDDEAQSILS